MFAHAISSTSADDDHDGEQRPLDNALRSRELPVPAVDASVNGSFEVVLLIRRAPVGRHRRFANLRLVGHASPLSAASTDWPGFSRAMTMSHHQDALVERRFLAANQRLGADRDGDVERATDIGSEEVRSA